MISKSKNSILHSSFRSPAAIVTLNQCQNMLPSSTSNACPTFAIHQPSSPVIILFQLPRSPPPPLPRPLQNTKHSPSHRTHTHTTPCMATLITNVHSCTHHTHPNIKVVTGRTSWLQSPLSAALSRAIPARYLEVGVYPACVEGQRTVWTVWWYWLRGVGKIDS